MLASIGTGRYRSDLMKYKRAQKQKYKRNIAKGKGNADQGKGKAYQGKGKADQGKGKANQGKGKDTPRTLLTPRTVLKPRCAGGGHKEASSSSWEGRKWMPWARSFKWMPDSYYGETCARWGPYNIKWTEHGEWVTRFKGCTWAIRGCDPQYTEWDDAVVVWSRPA